MPKTDKWASFNTMYEKFRFHRNFLYLIYEGL